MESRAYSITCVSIASEFEVRKEGDAERYRFSYVCVGVTSAEYISCQLEGVFVILLADCQ